MDKINKLLLEAFKASLLNTKVDWTEDLSTEDWVHFFQASDVHHILPMVFEAVYTCPAFLATGTPLLQGLKMQSIQTVYMQTARTEEFRRLYPYLREKGIMPCVVKGIICRQLYPNPDYRISADEDVFVQEEQFEACHEALTDYGLVPADPGKDIHEEFEVPYGKPGSPIYVEFHKHMFPPESEAYGDLNRFFDGIHAGRIGTHKGICGLIEQEIDGVKYLTMNPTDHLLYLILHSFKHFLHSGFGLRQVSDINLFACAHGGEIDWEYVLACLQDVRADLFAASMFRIGEKYMTFDPVKASYPQSWSSIEVDESDMLTDLLASGIYGQSDMSRKHSSNITLNAVIADKRGETAKTGRFMTALKTVCLPVDKMVGRFPYLKSMHFLLPVAWIQRVWIYRKETAGNAGGNNASESIKIGNERVELMRRYGIIK